VSGDSGVGRFRGWHQDLGRGPRRVQHGAPADDDDHGRGDQKEMVLQELASDHAGLFIWK